MTRSLANGKIGFALELVLFAPSSIRLKRITKVRRKKSKTSETTSGSASGGIDLNDEADEETEELRPMGRDRSKAKKRGVAKDKMDENDMQIDKGVREDGEDVGESNSEGSGGSSD
ncbi:hypothetical protein Tco_0280249 [Tanacetum coccineum]